MGGEAVVGPVRVIFGLRSVALSRAFAVVVAMEAADFVAAMPVVCFRVLVDWGFERLLG